MYNIMFLLRCTFACVFLFLTGSLHAQDDCTASLAAAQRQFDEGHLYEVEPTLSECLKNLSREQRVEAYRLLSLTNLFIGEHEKADNSYIELLRADPEWRPGPADEVEIEYLSKRFKTTPIFTLYPGKIGGNFAMVGVINANSSGNLNNSSHSYASRFGFQVGGGADWNISDRFSLGGEVLFTVKNHRLVNRMFQDPNGSTLGDSLQINYNTIGFEVPLLFRYHHIITSRKTGQRSKWIPFVYAGYIFHYNVDYNAKPEYYDVNGVAGAAQNVNPDVGRTLSIGSIRNNINHSIMGGVGVKYRIKYRYIMAEVRYAYGLKNQVNVDNQFDFKNGNMQDPVREYVFRFTQVDDDFRLNQVYFNVGYVFPLYKARKIEKKGGLFRKKGSRDEE